MKAWFSRLIDRLMYGPRCPDCAEHYARTHSHNGCQSAVYTDHGDPAGLCPCNTSYGGRRRPTRIEHETAEAAAL